MLKISVVIPTYTRQKDLKECLDSILIQTLLPIEIIVVDNEKSRETEKIISEEIKKFELKGIKLIYIANTIENSLTVAKNLGVRVAIGNVVSFLDDDVILEPDYYKEIIKVFEIYPDALGVSGYPVLNLKLYEKIALYLLNLPLRIFYQNHYRKNRFKHLPSLGVTFSFPNRNTQKIISACEWLSGASTFKKEVFNEFIYDENLKKYSWGEDQDFGYRIYKKHPSSLYFNLNAKYIHKLSASGRIANKELAYMEEIYFLYLFYKLFDHTLKNKLIYIWGRIGRIIFKIFFLFHSRRPLKLMDIVYSLQAYIYCLKHIEEIKLPRNKIIDRETLILQKIKNKKVLNIGCSDYPDTENKIKNNDLFHIKMLNYASMLHGIDISKQGIELMKKEGINNIIVEDIYNIDTNLILLKQKFDIIVISEVIEHLPNVGEALKKVYNYILKTNPTCQVIITAPNIHNFIFRIFEMFRNIETVHEDHCYYFSYYTLSKTLKDQQFIITNFKYVLYRKKSFIYYIILNLMNIFSTSFLPYCYIECKINYSRIQ